MMSKCPFWSNDINDNEYSNCCPYCKNFIGGFTAISADADKKKLSTISDAYKLLFENDNLDYDNTNTIRNSLKNIINDKHATQEAEKFLNMAAHWALILLQTGAKLTNEKENLNSDTNFKEYVTQPNFYNDDRLELLERFGDGTGLPEHMRSTVEKIRTTLYGTAVRAESLIAGCTDFRKHTLRRSCLDAVKEFLSEYDKEEIIIFISAPTRNYTQKPSSEINESIEYCVAKKLKEQLEFMGIKVFWWETFNSPESPYAWDQRKDDLNISAKIAYGLAVSSIFISLAFDEQNYVNSENCLYELNTFIEYLDKDIMPFILKGEELQDKIVIKQTGKNDVVVNSTDLYFRELTSIISEFKSKLKKGRKQYCRVLNVNGLEFLRAKAIDSYNFVYDNSDQRYVKCKNYNLGKIHKQKNRETAIREYTSKALREIWALLRSSYPSKYDDLKRKSRYSDENEFVTWFCNPEKDISIAVDDEFVSYAKKHRELNFCEVQNTPSNYNMLYAIIDSKGYPVNDKFLIFMENRGYNADLLSLDIVLNLVINDTNRYYSEKATLNELQQVLVGTYEERSGDFYYNGAKYSKIKVIINQTHQNLVEGDLRYYTNQGGKLTFARDSDTINSICKYGCKIVLYNSEESKCEFDLFLYANYKEGNWGKKIDKRRLFSNCLRYLRCPYCGHVLKYDKKTNTYGSETVTFNIANNKGTTTYTHIINEKGHIVCQSRNSHTNNTKTRELPQDYLNKNNKSAVILMLGVRNSGKSVFISKLFDIWYTNDEMEIGDGDDRVRTTGISFDGRDFKINFAQPELRYIKSALSRYFDISYSAQADSGDLRDYCSIPYYKFMSKTMTKALDLNYLPSMLLELKRENNKSVDTLSLIDIPGEALENAISVLGNDSAEERRHEEQNDRIFDIFHNCDAMIFMLDLDDQSHISSLETLMNNINKKSNVAVAIAVCKFDKYEERLNRDYAPINSFIPNEDSKFYAGSDRDKYINFASDKIKEFIKDYCIEKYGVDSYSKLANAIKGVPFHKFFAVSAIGNKEAIFEDERKVSDDAYRCSTRFTATPRGIDNVILWLTYQLGIID